ncbi:MAG: hypothetical protein ACRD9Q_08790 [Nitrososphaeraceae archaeon]
MKITDIPNPDRVNRTPDQSIVLFTEQNYLDHGFRIQKVELKLFVEKTDDSLGPYSLITSFVDTDKGSIEMIYDEGYRGINPLGSAKELLIKNLGMSGLILRSIIALEVALKTS